MTFATVSTPPAIQLKLNEPSDLEQLEQVQIVRDWIKEGGLDPERYEKENINHIGWNFLTESGVSVAIAIYRADNIVYVYFETAIAKVTPAQETQIANFLLHNNYSLYWPYRIAINDGLILAQFRAPLSHSTVKGFKEMLGSLISFSNTILTEIQERYDIKSFVGSLHGIDQNE